MSHLTGSDELPAACFVNGKTANADYGVAIRKSDGGCPNCHGPVDAVLAWNPSDGYFYLAPCPICLKFIRYYDNNGNLADFKVMTSAKTTEIDQNLDVMDRY